jgi:hypothetical protein
MWAVCPGSPRATRRRARPRDGPLPSPRAPPGLAPRRLRSHLLNLSVSSQVAHKEARPPDGRLGPRRPAVPLVGIGARPPVPRPGPSQRRRGTFFRLGRNALKIRSSPTNGLRVRLRCRWDRRRSRTGGRKRLGRIPSGPPSVAAMWGGVEDVRSCAGGRWEHRAGRATSGGRRKRPRRSGSGSRASLLRRRRRAEPPCSGGRTPGR